MDQVRQLRSDAHIRPNEGDRKVYLLEQADRMNQSAQNAMLKLLENGGGLLSTIRSRCEMLNLLPLTPAECEQWLGKHYPKEEKARLHQAALECQGVLGRAVEELEGTGTANAAVRDMAQALARAMERGEELELFQTAMSLEKLGKEELGAVLDRTVVEIAALLPMSREKRRLLNGVELLRKLRGAVELNANAGQLSGWLCAGLFLED